MRRYAPERIFLLSEWLPKLIPSFFCLPRESQRWWSREGLANIKTSADPVTGHQRAAWAPDKLAIRWINSILTLVSTPSSLDQIQVGVQHLQVVLFPVGK